jgi:HPt (histidine-containing phosphotransfer) domain-containing protein
VNEVNADPDVLERLRVVGGPRLVRELIELFMRYAPERIAIAKAGIEQGDLGATQRALHSLKSSAGQLGVIAIQEGSSRGESLAANGDAAGAEAALAEIEALWPATREWLTEQVRL